MRSVSFRFPTFPVIALTIVAVIAGCKTGIEDSPQPGTVRVMLRADPADTTIVILTDTITVSNSDSIDLTMFQSKVFSGQKFAVLYQTKSSYRQEDVQYNVLRRENGEYATFTIYDSFVPPGSYTGLQLGITASILKLFGVAPIQLQLRPGAPSLMSFSVNFDVVENRTTEITVEISPLKSLSRYRDIYYFDRQVTVSGVRTY